MKLLKKQRGMSYLGWVTVLCMAGILVITGIKLFPVYLEYYSVAQALEEMSKDPALKGKPKNEIASAFLKRLSIDRIKFTRDEYSITKVEGRKVYVVEVHYEVRRPLFGNLEIVATFNRSAEVGE